MIAYRKNGAAYQTAVCFTSPAHGVDIALKLRHEWFAAAVSFVYASPAVDFSSRDATILCRFLCANYWLL